MKNISNFCLTLNPKHENLIKELSYTPVVLGKKIVSKEIFSDKTGNNISHKNPYYGEYTFHYWIWKNYLDQLNTEWVGFCQYRKFFIIRDVDEINLTFKDLKDISINKITDDLNDFDCILGKKFSVENYKLIKIIKHHLKDFLLNPLTLFSKKKRTLKFHFDLFHGKGNLDKAIDLLDVSNKSEFNKFMNSQTSFNPHNMFICKTKFLKSYYDSVFPWLEKCEEIFGFKDLDGYGMQRIYGFLAERYLSYWFLKNCKVKELKIIVKDLSDYKDL